MDKKLPDYAYSERASVWEKHKRFKKSLKVEEKISRKNFKREQTLEQVEIICKG